MTTCMSGSAPQCWVGGAESQRSFEILIWFLLQIFMSSEKKISEYNSLLVRTFLLVIVPTRLRCDTQSIVKPSQISIFPNILWFPTYFSRLFKSFSCKHLGYKLIAEVTEWSSLLHQPSNLILRNCGTVFTKSSQLVPHAGLQRKWNQSIVFLRRVESNGREGKEDKHFNFLSLAVIWSLWTQIQIKQPTKLAFVTIKLILKFMFFFVVKWHEPDWSIISNNASGT